MNNKKEISMLNILLLVIVFMLFDLVLIFYHQIPQRFLVGWNPFSGKPVFYPKEIGIFIMPILTISLILFFSLFSALAKDSVQKKKWQTAKILIISFLIILYFISFLKNFYLPELSLIAVKISIFSLLAFLTGLLFLVNFFSNFKLLFKLNKSLFPSILSLFEGILLILISLTSLFALSFNTSLKSLNLIAFISSLGYGALLILSFIAQKFFEKQQVTSLAAKISKQNNPENPPKKADYKPIAKNNFSGIKMNL